MRIKTALIAVGLVLITACTTNTAGLMLGEQSRPVDLAELPSMNVRNVSVTVPTTLSVSESDGIKPDADIVWRGDPYGNRYVQVKKVMQTGLNRGAASIKGKVPVNVSVVVTQFHAQTERARYTVGGRHEIKFQMEVKNAKTGEVIIPAYIVDATFQAYGGNEALQAERNNNGQKARIERQLAAVLRRELDGTALPQNP